MYLLLLYYCVQCTHCTWYCRYSAPACTNKLGTYYVLYCVLCIMLYLLLLYNCVQCTWYSRGGGKAVYLFTLIHWVCIVLCIMLYLLLLLYFTSVNIMVYAVKTRGRK